MLALTAFAVSNLGFLPGSDINMSIFSIRTLVDFSGVLILTVQHEQLRENALHGELAAMDEVLRRQYEQYKRSKEGVNLINRRYHELKIQLARIRQEPLRGSECLDLLMIAKYLERIGDHAVNVAEWVEYSITGVHAKE